MKPSSRFGLAAVATACLVFGAHGAAAQNLKVETGNAAGLTTLIPQLLAKSLAGSGVELQINADQTLTRSALSLGTGRIDAAIVPPPAYSAMTHGAGPYAKAGEAAKKAAANIRSLFTFAGGTFQPIVWADSGIRDWKDMKGKRIFIGPPAGAANRQITGLLRLAGGLEPDADYKPVRLGWGAAVQAFQDGQFDVLVGAFPVGSAVVQQISLQRKIRIIGIDDKVLQTAKWNQYLAQMGEMNTTIAPGTYDGQANKDTALRVAAYAMIFAVNASMSDDLAYRITKTYRDNVESYKKSVASLAQLPTHELFAGNNIVLHPGAQRYYEEQGKSVPDALKAGK